MPAFGGPISAICAAPSGRMTTAGPPRAPPLLGALEFFGQFLDAPLDIALEMVGPLVLWNRAQHLPQPLQALPRVARLPGRGLYRLVLRREVGRHDVSARAPEA